MYVCMYVCMFVCVCACMRVCVTVCISTFETERRRVGFIIQYERSPVLYSAQSFNELDTAQHGYRLNTPSQLRDTCLLDHGIVYHMTISRLYLYQLQSHRHPIGQMHKCWPYERASTHRIVVIIIDGKL